MTNYVSRLSVLVLPAILFGTPVLAQTPRPAAASQTTTQSPPVHSTGTGLLPSYDLSGGYQMLKVPDHTFPFGLNIDAAKNFGPWSIVGELGWAIRSDDQDANGFDADVLTNVFHGGVGPRWTGRNKGSIWPFAQVLGGFYYARQSVEVGDVDISDSTTRFMLQPGAGVVFVAGDGWGIVAQGDYRRVFLDEDEDGESGQNQFRLFVGVRLILD